MNADAPRKRILPSFPDLVKELSQTSFAAKEDIERVAREVVTEELSRIKQGSSPRGMDALVGKAQRLLDPPPPPTGASILDEGDPFL
ncbi:MAG: hypothetical protein JNK60_02300, partial [Acidobacteria bacterium]|nr:hypothetical protein [Acidobacteriota bacterium]